MTNPKSTTRLLTIFIKNQPQKLDGISSSSKRYCITSNEVLTRIGEGASCSNCNPSVCNAARIRDTAPFEAPSTFLLDKHFVRGVSTSLNTPSSENMWEIARFAEAREPGQPEGSPELKHQEEEEYEGFFSQISGRLKKMFGLEEEKGKESESNPTLESEVTPKKTNL